MDKVQITDKTTNIVYYFIGVTKISPEVSATLTEYPIPEGNFISDHSYKNPYSLGMGLIADGYDAITKKTQYIAEDGSIQSLSYSSLKELLNNWLDNAVLLDIQTVHGLFKSACLTNLSWTEGQDSWSKYSPSLTFKEARIASINTTKIETLNVSDSADYSTESNSGETSGTEVTSESVVGETLAGAAIGAGVGAIVGSIIPGVGTAIGAGVGAAIGGVIGFLKSLF